MLWEGRETNLSKVPAIEKPFQNAVKLISTRRPPLPIKEDGTNDAQLLSLLVEREARCLPLRRRLPMRPAEDGARRVCEDREHDREEGGLGATRSGRVVHNLGVGTHEVWDRKRRQCLGRRAAMGMGTNEAWREWEREGEAPRSRPIRGRRRCSVRGWPARRTGSLQRRPDLCKEGEEISAERVRVKAEEEVRTDELDDPVVALKW